MQSDKTLSALFGDSSYGSLHEACASLQVCHASEQVFSKLFLHVGTMLHLFSVIECGGMEAGSLRIACLSDVERCESIDCHEGCEMHPVAGSSEDVLMEQEVCTEEDQCGFEVDHGRVARARGHS